MATFNYIAVNRFGKRLKGVIEAESSPEARQQLRDQGLLPIMLASRFKSPLKIGKRPLFLINQLFAKRIRAADLSLITRQMATLIQAGLPIDEVLTALIHQSEKSSIKSILLGVRRKVLEGHPLASGLGEFPNVFSKVYRTTIAAGEESGNLGAILNRLADYTERQKFIKQKILQALIYPLLMSMVSILVVIFLLTYVVPKIISVFNETHQHLPLATTILLHVSYLFRHYGVFIGVLLFITLFYIRYLLNTKHSMRIRMHTIFLKLPLIGKCMRTVNSARFARTFSVLAEATVPVLEAMHSASALISILPMREAVKKAIHEVREGTAIYVALEKTGYFSPMFIHLIASGESSGQLVDMLKKTADQQERDVSVFIDTLITLFEPMMIMIMGSVVLFIVLAIMLPIFSLDQLAG